MQQNIEFERCIDKKNRIKKKKKRQFPEIQNVNQTVAFSCIFKSNKF